MHRCLCAQVCRASIYLSIYLVSELMKQTQECWYLTCFNSSELAMGLLLASTYQCTCLNIHVSHLLPPPRSAFLSNWKANKQYVQLSRNASTWKCVKISFATWHANCKWNTWNVQSDTQLSHTLPVQMLKEKRLDLSKNKCSNWSWVIFLKHWKDKVKQQQ